MLHTFALEINAASVPDKQEFYSFCFGLVFQKVTSEAEFR